jgi:hypothetical protein
MSLSTTLSTAISKINGPAITYGGYTTPLPATSLVNDISLEPNSIADNYSLPGQTGFYQNVFNTVSLQPAVFVPSPYDYILSVSQSGTFTTAATYKYQYDTIITDKPTITSVNFNFTGAIPSSQVCGITILYSTPIFTVSTIGSTMGNLYYSNPLIEYSANITGSAWTPSTESNLTNIRSGKLVSSFSGPLIIVNSNVKSPSLDAHYASTLTLSVLANNVFGKSSPLSAPPISYIVDGPSYILVYKTLAQGISTNPLAASVPQHGCRCSYANFVTAMPPWSLPTVYNNSTSIVDPSEELQVSNGKFVTLSATTIARFAYLNYTGFLYDSVNFHTNNYSGVLSSKYRYATFIWKFTNVSSSYTNLTFNILGTNGINITNSLLFCSDNITPINMYYRIIDSAFPVPGTGAKAYSSSWINANTTDPKGGTVVVVTSGNYTTNAVEGSAVNLMGVKAITLAGTTATVGVIIPTTTFTTATNTVYIVFRIGLPMNKNVSFQTVQATIS